MTTKEKKLAKLIWLAHWAVNIAPNFNGLKKAPYSLNLCDIRDRIRDRYNAIK